MIGRHFPNTIKKSADPRDCVVLTSSELIIGEFLQQQAHAVNQITIGIVSLIRNFALLYPQVLLLLYLIQMKLESVPYSITGLLSDNIILIDFLGRRHSLQYCYLKEWSVVYAMLRTKSEDARGFEYVLKHQFMLEKQLSRNRFQLFNPHTWSQLRPGARVVMSARLPKIPFSSGTCTLCGQRVSSTARKTWICNLCGIDFRSLEAEVLPATSETLLQPRPQGRFCSEFFITDKPLGKCKYQMPSLIFLILDFEFGGIRSLRSSWHGDGVICGALG